MKLAQHIPTRAKATVKVIRNTQQNATGLQGLFCESPEYCKVMGGDPHWGNLIPHWKICKQGDPCLTTAEWLKSGSRQTLPAVVRWSVRPPKRYCYQRSEAGEHAFCWWSDSEIHQIWPQHRVCWHKLTSGMFPGRENQALSASPPAQLLGTCTPSWPTWTGAAGLGWQDIRERSFLEQPGPGLAAARPSRREMQTSIPKGAFVTAAKPDLNQDSSLGGDSSVWFPWVRLLPEPRLSEIFCPSFMGWQLSSAPARSPLQAHLWKCMKIDASNEKESS